MTLEALGEDSTEEAGLDLGSETGRRRKEWAKHSGRGLVQANIQRWG